VQWFGPVFNACGGSGTPDEVIERVAKDEKVTDTQLNEVMASSELRFRNQVQWARDYLPQV
jgi:restriction system protein